MAQKEWLRPDLVIGARVKVTDTFLTGAPFWTGEIVARDVEDIEIRWDDGSRNSGYDIADFDHENCQKKIEVI